MKAGFLNGKLSTKQVILNADSIFHSLRWLNGVVVCPYCGEVHKIYQAKDGSFNYKCGKCKNRFSDRTKTLLHNSKLSTEIWMQAVYEVFTDNFISSVKLAVKLHINQKSAWLLLVKLRFGLTQDDYLLNGMIAQDEMYVGGSLSNMHYRRKLDLLRSNHYILPNERKYDKTAIFALNSQLKTPVFGLNDGKNIILQATPNPIKKQYIQGIVKKHVAGDSITVSDESQLYNDWKEATGLDLFTNNHHNNQYQTKEGYTSNRIENTFSWFKRGFGGTITHCKYVQLYLNEFVYRYNTRTLSHEDRFKVAVQSTIGKTVTYKQIRENDYLKHYRLVKKGGFSEEQLQEMASRYGSLFGSIEQNHKKYTK